MYFFPKFFPEDSDATESDSSDSDMMDDEPDQRVEISNGSGASTSNVISKPTESLVPALPAPPVESAPSSSAAPKAPGVSAPSIPASSEPKPASAVAKAKPVEGAYWGSEKI